MTLSSFFEINFYWILDADSTKSDLTNELDNLTESMDLRFDSIDFVSLTLIMDLVDCSCFLAFSILRSLWW